MMSNIEYGHGIVSKNCVVRKQSDLSTVRVVCLGELVQIHSCKQDSVVFCFVGDNMQVDSRDLWLCDKNGITPVPENLWGPLFPLKEADRLKIIRDKKISESLENIDIGSFVHVLDSDYEEVCLGQVTFRNCIAKLAVGVYFGIEILESRENKQEIANKVSIMKPFTKGFPRNCDVVVTIDRIRRLNIDKEQEINEFEKQSNNSDFENQVSYKTMLVLHLREKSPNSSKKSYSSNSNYGLCEKHSNGKPLALGEEVVYIFDHGPEKGVVKWLGYLDNSFKVGVEFDNPVGSSTGIVNGVELFKTNMGHASVMPPEGLIRLTDFLGNDAKERSINNNNNNNTMFSDNHRLANDEKAKRSLQHSKCPQHSERSFQSNYAFHTNLEDDLLNNKSKLNIARTSDLLIHHTSKSFDLSKPVERKYAYKRYCNSMDSGQETKLLTKEQNISTPITNYKNPKQELCDLIGHSFCKQDEYSQSKNSSKFLNDDDSEDDNADLVNMRLEQDFNDFTDKDVWEPKYSPNSSSDESASYYDTPKPIYTGSLLSGELGEGSVVEVMYKKKPHYGVIRWIGMFPDDKERLIAGIEMEEERTGFTDGTFNNRRYFKCNSKKALFVPLHLCQKDSRFVEEAQRQLASTKVNSFGQIDCPIVEGTIPPINCKGDVDVICGKNRGIQGHHNSCYLDATLFAMFTFTGVFDSLLYRPQIKSDIQQYADVQKVLRDEIVNPLRKNLYVRADRVMKLRTLMEKLSSVSGLTSEEKDPEEFLNSLVAQILKAEPFLKLSSGQEAFCYQLFVEKDERLSFPSVQQLLEQSFLTSDIKLKQVPSCLIIQMPRFGKSFKMYSRILPPQLLDVTDIIENSPRQCTVCGKLAELECKDCFGQNGIGNGLENISFCSSCLETAHSHHCRARHNYRSLTVPTEFAELQEHCAIPRIFMELFAVVCIETSHYVSFVKCGSGADAPWCFFDSMADRKGEQNGYNIPEMVPCPDLPYWLSEDGAKTLNEMRDERQLPPHAKRLLCDAYMCMYQSPDMMMYR